MASLNPKDYGAESAADVGIFFVGAAAGGLVDAALNSFGFASPLVVAGLGGGGALGVKKLVWDGWWLGRRRRRRYPGGEVEVGYRALMAEAELIETTGDMTRANMLRRLIDVGERRGMKPEDVRRIFERY
ncbi:MAG TPA: hypothetical protein VF718_10240 [Allosphingosinicella sp.]|jgi:hypothetical protein